MGRGNIEIQGVVSWFRLLLPPWNEVIFPKPNHSVIPGLYSDLEVDFWFPVIPISLGSNCEVTESFRWELGKGFRAYYLLGKNPQVFSDIP